MPDDDAVSGAAIVAQRLDLLFSPFGATANQTARTAHTLQVRQRSALVKPHRQATSLAVLPRRARYCCRNCWTQRGGESRRISYAAARSPAISRPSRIVC